MGSGCSSSCCNQGNIESLRDEINSDWLNALKEGDEHGVTMLHVDDPSVIDAPVNLAGDRAIHYVARCKGDRVYLKILSYLANPQNGADVNIKATRTGNTALHEAALAQNDQAIQLLLENGADHTITNRKGLTPREVTNVKKITKLFSPMNIKKRKVKGDKMKQYLMSERDSLEHLQKQLLKHGGVFLDDKRFKTSKKHKTYKDLTPFGQKIGIDLDDVAIFLQKANNKKALWHKSVGKLKKSISKDLDLYKLMFCLVQGALAKRNSQAKIPDDQTIREVTGKMKQILIKKLPAPKNKRKKWELKRKKFVHDFHRYLFTLHDEMIMGH